MPLPRPPSGAPPPFFALCDPGATALRADLPRQGAPSPRRVRLALKCVCGRWVCICVPWSRWVRVCALALGLLQQALDCGRCRHSRPVVCVGSALGRAWQVREFAPAHAPCAESRLCWVGRHQCHTGWIPRIRDRCRGRRGDSGHDPCVRRPQPVSVDCVVGVITLLCVFQYMGGAACLELVWQRARRELIKSGCAQRWRWLWHRRVCAPPVVCNRSAAKPPVRASAHAGLSCPRWRAAIAVSGV